MCVYYLRIDFYNLNLGPYSEKDAFINSRGTKWKANRNQMKSGQLCYFMWDAQGIVGWSGSGLRTVAYTADSSALWHSFWSHVSMCFTSSQNAAWGYTEVFSLISVEVWSSEGKESRLFRAMLIYECFC